MTNVVSQKPLRVLTALDAGPYMIVPVSQLAQVRRLLDDREIRYSVDESSISIDGKPAVVFIDMRRDVNASEVQALLDANP